RDVDKSGRSQRCTSQAFRWQNSIAIVLSSERGLRGAGPMRDIRSDLRERAALIDEQIRAAYAHFERMLQQLQSEQDATIADLNSTLVIIAKLIEFEQGFFAPPVPSSPLVALADRFMHRLNEVGQMSREELIELAVKEGFFPDADSAVQGV